jgi:hypothetical protein
MAKETPMQLAEILSDLVSLRVCVRSTPSLVLPSPFRSSPPCTDIPQDPAAALALVSARPNPSSATTNPSAATDQKGTEEEQDTDLKRAKDLVELHYAVKEAHKRGELGKGLLEARRAVEGAVGG